MANIFFDDFESYAIGFLPATNYSAFPTPLPNISLFVTDSATPYAGKQYLCMLRAGDETVYCNIADGSNGNAQASGYFNMGSERGGELAGKTGLFCRITNTSPVTWTAYGSSLDFLNSFVSLSQYVAGSQTLLANVSVLILDPNHYFYHRLKCIGSIISVQLYDTIFKKYLNSSGNWVTDNSGLTECISVINTAVPTGTSAFAGFELANVHGEPYVTPHLDNFSFDVLFDYLLLTDGSFLLLMNGGKLGLMT